MSEDAVPLSAWEWPGVPLATLLDSGLINRTWQITVHNTPVAVIQQLNTSVFSPEVHHGIQAVTEHLAAQGLLTPRLVPTTTGNLWHTTPQGQVWRRLTWVGNRTLHRLNTPAEAQSAGELVASFHTALTKCKVALNNPRPFAHDTPTHMARLQQALGLFQQHRLYHQVAPLAETILDHWEHWSGPTNLPTRLVHGDLKVSNLRFTGVQAVAVIDLDTLGYGTLDAELGDALRSWCNPASEDSATAHFDLPVFRSAIQGYAQTMRNGPPLSGAEWESIVPGVERISLELAARFATDALEERYFAWNPRYGTRGQHNLLRATGQLALAQSVFEQRAQAQQELLQARQS